MEYTGYQTSFALKENITFDEKVNIKDILPSEQTGSSNRENIDIKEEPIDPQFLSAHEGRKQSGFSSFQQSGFSSFQNKMEKDIEKLFEELDMMSRHDHDQM